MQVYGRCIQMMQDSRMYNMHIKVNKNEICAYINGQMCAGYGKYRWKM
jgi:hypothetical protein